MNVISENRSFGGRQLRVEHASESTGGNMTFALYLPPQAESGPVPVLYWLSGLTCTDENFVTKAGAQSYAASAGLAVVAPDTSPRGNGVPDDPEAAYDFGLGAGFYVNATQAPFAANYRMYDYIASELPALVESAYALDGERRAISGHSMGGHGALTIALRHPDRYRSVSAFAPICSPTRCPWGEKALGGYLGPDRAKWADHDASLLIERAAAGDRLPMLIDQGTADDFLTEQLKPELLEAAAANSGYPVEVRRQEGYDHSYFFIASFIGEHIAFHARHLS